MQNNITTKPEQVPPPPSSQQSLVSRLVLALGILALGGAAYLFEGIIGTRGRAFLGVLCFIGTACVFSRDLRRVSLRTVLGGLSLQVILALFVLSFRVGDVRPGYEAFRWVGNVVKQFLEFSSEGGKFVFGVMADQEALGSVHPNRGFIFAFGALPTVVFVASFFAVLYHLGVLQAVVKVLARGMVWLMGTSGAETLCAAANIFMGQTEAPLIVKPYVERMTESELLSVMVGGMATIAAGVMAIYIGMKADAVAILATSVMAAPCSLYLAKILIPESAVPETLGHVRTAAPVNHRNVIDAASAGASEGMQLALNIAAMLIAFLAFIALFNYLIGLAFPGVTLGVLFGWAFAPVAYLVGVEKPDLKVFGGLLGTKLAANEFVAFLELAEAQRTEQLSDRSHVLATFALAGFANFSSIGIQIGGIGAMAPSRRGDLARLGGTALLAGSLATLINAALASILL